jgi:hypothetical protein
MLTDAAASTVVSRALSGWASALFLLCWSVLMLLAPAPSLAQSIEAVLAPGEVTQGHAKYENECKNCHVRFNPKGQDKLCADCHKEVRQDLLAHTGFHGRNKADATCRSCHTDHKGRGARIVVFETRKFDHKQTDYELHGKHVKVECQKCHEAGRKYWQASQDCHVCHKKDDDDKGHHGGIKEKCSECHADTGWKDTRFDHFKKSKFALEDKHDKRQCDDCHAKGRYKDTPNTCAACHKKDDDKSGHKGQFGEKCQSCHNAKGWKDIAFNHDSDTHYPLRGKHRKTECTDCHTGHLYKQKLPEQCWDCHKKDDKHKESLGKDCAPCHSESGWKDPPRFNHNDTRFPLLGKHDKVACNDCHKSATGKDAKMYKDVPMDCYGCHKKDDKHEGTLGEKCVDCHAERDWKNTHRFDHDKTRFALRNGHAKAETKCTDCHGKTPLKSFRNTERSCFACHKKDDKHEGTQGKECDQCHNDRNWKTTTFDHARTRFPLTGGHTTVECKACHKSQRFKETQRECVACHLKDDQHKARLGTNCESCHNTRHWRSWLFNHNKQTKYALTGAHIRVKCESCHTDNAPKGKPIAPVGQRCYDCHAKDDTHDGQFGDRCDQCHVSDSWKQLDKPLRNR